MLTLHLVRHGETNWNAERRCQGQSDSVLTELGKQQAANRRPHIEPLQPVSLYSSSSVRTLQTTEVLNKNLALPVVSVDELREIRLGPWEKQLWDDIQTTHPQQVHQFREQPEKFQLDGAETFQQLSERGMQAIEAIVDIESARSGDHHVLVVSHGAIITALMMGFAGVDVARIWQIEPLANCSHSVIEANGSDRKVVSMAGVPLADTAWFS